ncbi:uncharacterized protein PAC_01982 [Phialocephala subalpina]|uniref:Uncharacterized protein n=1 Tax=Phialocephala subalpina TaxID=576137 RepID=A0A1L7WH83_9HELO|nr:uncharacterized protein PAC_01982 [Phialocephala subalpina]
MDTSITPISLDGDTIAISRGTDGDCNQLSFSSKSPHPPSSRPAFPSQPNPVSTSITHPDTLLQPSDFQLWAVPPSSPLSAAAAPTSTNQNNGSSTVRPPRPPLSTSTYDPLSTAASSTSSSSSAQANDGPPVTHLPPSASSHLSPPRNVINHALPSTVSSASSSTVPRPCDPAEYFSNEVGSNNTKRIGYLVEATKDFIQSASLDRRIFTTVLGLWLRIFDGGDDDDSGNDSGDGPSSASGSDPTLRLTDLSRVYATIERQFHFADFLYIVYFAHEIEQVIESLDRKVGQGIGRGRQTVAFSETAGALGMQEKEVKAMITRSRNYMLLLQYGGPGFLLQIGPSVNALWQHRLKEDDIRVLLKYRKDHLPELDEQARALAPFASRILAVGMVAFGWSYCELEATSSGLTDSIRQHTDLQQLARDAKDLTITQSLRYLEVEGGPIQKKRRCSDSDDARPVKRVRPLQSGEPDISLMTGLSPMPGEQEMPMMTWLLPMPGELEITDMTGLLPMPEELPISTGMQPFQGPGMSTMQPTQTLGQDASMMSNRQLTTECPQTYENWADETQGWK